MQAIKTFVVDAFTHQPFKGNPAAVCLVENDELSDSSMQTIGAELNLSETAFLRPLEPNGADATDARKFQLRWFTPTNEVPLCGHATLASAHVLFNEVGNTNDQIEFETASGILLAVRKDMEIVLDFPLNEPEKIDPALVKEISDIVGLDLQEVSYSASTKKLLIRISDKYELETLKNMPALRSDALLSAKTPDIQVKGVIVTLKGSEGFHFYSRYFAPWVGIPEDPVTGSAHTVLGPYWSKIIGTRTLKAFQCSPRGGELTMTIREDRRVDLVGRAVTVLRGELLL